MKLDYKSLERFRGYIDKLHQQCYEQPSDDGHTDWARDAIYNLIPFDTDKVLDVGCGSGFAEELFANVGVEWDGQDFFRDGSDFSFLPYKDKSYDLIFARHVLEHSPMPLISLMEWHRISRKYAIIILPAPEYWNVYGRNHYYCLPKDNWWNLFDVAGWKIVDDQDFTTSHPLFMKHYMVENEPKDRIWHGPPKTVEFRYLLEKK